MVCPSFYVVITALRHVLDNFIAKKNVKILFTETNIFL